MEREQEDQCDCTNRDQVDLNAVSSNRILHVIDVCSLPRQMIGVISQLGILIARGAVLSAILVLVFLPSMLANMEPVIKRTTRKLHFYTLARRVNESCRPDSF